MLSKERKHLPVVLPKDETDTAAKRFSVTHRSRKVLAISQSGAFDVTSASYPAPKKKNPELAFVRHLNGSGEYKQKCVCVCRATIKISANQQLRVSVTIGPPRPIHLVAWPARTPDLIPLDYILWGHIKDLIYETPVESEVDLLARIIAAADLGLPGIGDRVYQNMVHMYRVCVDVAGRYIESFL
ncbi:hypothetical protein PR048_003432 [Dryococelus australis]|uniref:Uncharacterized protein n=1 Tax=Dryococelus australis TaxID=614101 RepID=A0ABQ9INK0_9NEOP|nr:hypothetical protein PR048_003432 [Dryococelus australis]